ncbi:MAG: thiamine pyrophosphate-binding protein [Myxococcales bacterium]|jgi:acetolactate synthase-1/2/3 large subunit|nr:thiamine pyrophosphate-binding protein [Myxococcales bacterium]MBL0196198.1 thiamine pyrophosphate-binding protein [Myxococcales bacterium]
MGLAATAAAAVFGQGTTTVKGGELVARMLAAEGVTHVFGIMDGTYLGLCAALRPNGIELVTPRHESSAAHMAGAYAQLTGRLGVCIASNGPGVANILPGVAVENAEGHRVLLITSCRREGIVYPDRGGAYQSFAQVDVTRPMTKWSGVVPSMDRLAELVRRALRECFEGRAGVVHLDVPESIFNGTLELGGDTLRSPSSYRSTTPMEASADQVREVARWLDEAKLPLIHAGSGVLCAGATRELAELAALLEAPVTTSWAARGAIDERDPHAISMIYVGAVNEARTSADRVLVLGSRLGETDWWGKAPYWGKPGEQELAQVDIDAETLGNARALRFAVRSDAKTFLKAVLAELGRRRGAPNLDPRRGHLAKLRSACAARRAELDKNRSDDGTPMHSAHVARVCQETFAEDAIMVADGGNTTIWAQFFHEVRRVNSMVGTPKMGMLGAGVSQTLGAQIAFPGRQVYCVIGDGAMGFHPQEIETAVRNRLPVVYLVLCDKQWGMVKINQSFALKPVKTLVFKTLGPDETINADLGEIQFDLLARAMGAHGERVSDPRGLRGAIQRSLASGKPAVIHVDVDPVKHMWAPELRTFKDMHQEPKS